MFDPWRLRTFRELAARGTMAAVAQALSLTPSAVSQQIAALEREAGAALVERNGRGVRLTVAGRALAMHAERILDALQAAADDVIALEADVSGPIRIAASASAAAALCPGVIRSLGQRYPAHRISLLERESRESIAALLRGDLDLALIDEVALPRAGQDSGLDHLELYVDPLYCVVPRDHPAGRRREVNIRDLAEEQWIMDDAWTAYYQLVLEACQAAGFEPRVIANCRSFEVVLSLVRAGCGIAILPGLGLAGARDLAIRPIKPRISRRVYAACRRGAIRRPAIATAITMFREAATPRQVGQPGTPSSRRGTTPGRGTRAHASGQPAGAAPAPPAR